MEKGFCLFVWLFVWEHMSIPPWLLLLFRLVPLWFCLRDEVMMGWMGGRMAGQRVWVCMSTEVVFCAGISLFVSCIEGSQSPSA